ncbi:MAG TPA: YegP family protein [Nannocystaceae bacterium]|nr:YegP family protein [Nannocystaceae bacterium]
MAFFQIRGSWYVLLRSSSDEVLLRSPELESEHACRNVAAKIRLAATVPDRYEQRASTNGGHYFVLRDDGGELLARSPIHASRGSCDAAIAEVRASAVRALAVATARREGVSPDRLPTADLVVIPEPGDDRDVRRPR